MALLFSIRYRGYLPVGACLSFQHIDSFLILYFSSWYLTIELLLKEKSKTKLLFMINIDLPHFYRTKTYRSRNSWEYQLHYVLFYELKRLVFFNLLDLSFVLYIHVSWTTIKKYYVLNVQCGTCYSGLLCRIHYVFLRFIFKCSYKLI